MARPRRAPTDWQLTGVTTEMHDLLLVIGRGAPKVFARARSGGAPADALGYKPSSGPNADGRGGGELTAPERAADRWFPHDRDDGSTQPPLGRERDPVREEALALAGLLNDALRTLRAVAGGIDRLLAGSPVGRVNTVELCAGCGQPAPRVKRLDGAAYHDPADPASPHPLCWWQAYRARSGDTTEAEAA